MLFRSTIFFYFSCTFILFISQSLILKLQLKILIYLPKQTIIMYSGTICNFVLYFTSLLSYFHNLKIKNYLKRYETLFTPATLAFFQVLEHSMAPHPRHRILVQTVPSIRNPLPSSLPR